MKSKNRRRTNSGGVMRPSSPPFLHLNFAFCITRLLRQPPFGLDEISIGGAHPDGKAWQRRGSFAIYDESMDEGVRERQHLNTRLHEALRAGRMTLAYQPQVDREGRVIGLEALARRALRAGDLNTARERLNEAIQLARGTGDNWSVAVGLNELGDVERVRGAYRRAGELYEESMSVFAQLGLGTQPSLAHNLGYVALASGEHARA